MANIDLKGDFLGGQPLKILTDLMGGNRRMAIGTVVEFWELAQHYWSDGEKLIPHKIYSIRGFPKEFYDPEINLAEFREEGIYARGSAERFDWLLQRRRAGKIGGEKAAASRRKKKQDSSENQAHAIAPAIAKPDLGQAPAIAPVPVPVPEKENPLNPPTGEAAGSVLISLWNEAIKNTPGCDMISAHELNPKRQRVAASRWKEKPSKEYWRIVFGKMAKSDFLNGREGNRKWRAGVDFALRPGVAGRVLEGQLGCGEKKREQIHPMAAKLKGEKNEI